ncbi:hypothetical protein [Dyadobacter psychrotolerans]|uniref:Uncharacterized protein n=1 Tax=Dyadobacter psychrotolerans TaxID=2541721 RepID=A0A4V2Z3I1_9BACT|nr:hypothetical protein [Dyadobacter psychrotolerans]TDE12738.1 hypothetical protein E0F88_20520 [Dyadobacter psychrotolerans]
MSSQAALFRILFHNETLFHTHEERSKVVIKTDKPVIDTVSQPAVIVKKALPIQVDTEPVAITAPKTPTPDPVIEFPTLNHKILILTDEPKHKEMLASESLFLDNILKAVKYSVSNADIINFSFLPGKDARNVLKEKKTNYFITFGVPLIKLNLDLLLVPYTPKLVEGIWFLLTDPLVVIEADRDLKRKLWQALQKIFEKA